jgi:hypothetical protein
MFLNQAAKKCSVELIGLPLHYEILSWSICSTQSHQNDSFFDNGMDSAVLMGHGNAWLRATALATTFVSAVYMKQTLLGKSRVDVF